MKNLTIPTADGLQLDARLYLPQGEPRAVVQINGATAAKRRYYEPFAQYLSDHGFAACIFDWLG